MLHELLLRTPLDDSCIKDWLPTWHLLAQSQQCKHQDNVWNLFKINNKVTRMTLMTLLWCLYCQLLTDFTHCSTVSIVDFEQVNTSWEGLLKVFMIFSKVFQSLNLFQIKFPKISCNFVKKEALAQVFSCEFCQIYQNTFSYRTPPVAASVKIASLANHEKREYFLPAT